MRNALLLLAVGLASCNEGSSGPDSGSPADGGARDDAGTMTCTLTGQWRGTLVSGPFAGQLVSWTFANGVTTAAFGSTTVNGTWSVSGTTASLTDTSSTPSSIACMSSVIGTYTLAWAQSCQQVTFTSQSEACDGRKLAIDGVLLTRQ